MRLASPDNFYSTLYSHNNALLDNRNPKKSSKGIFIREFSVNMWGRVIGDVFVGPHILEVT